MPGNFWVKELMLELNFTLSLSPILSALFNHHYGCLPKLQAKRNLPFLLHILQSAEPYTQTGIIHNQCTVFLSGFSAHCVQCITVNILL